MRSPAAKMLQEEAREAGRGDANHARHRIVRDQPLCRESRPQEVYPKQGDGQT